MSESHDNSMKNFDESSTSTTESTTAIVSSCTADHDKHRSAALFIIKTKEVLSISQTATDEILSNVTEMIQCTFSQIEAKVSNLLAVKGTSMSDIPDLIDVFYDKDL